MILSSTSLNSSISSPLAGRAGTKSSSGSSPTTSNSLVLALLGVNPAWKNWETAGFGAMLPSLTSIIAEGPPEGSRSQTTEFVIPTRQMLPLHLKMDETSLSVVGSTSGSGRPKKCVPGRGKRMCTSVSFENRARCARRPAEIAWLGCQNKALVVCGTYFVTSVHAPIPLEAELSQLGGITEIQN